MRAVLTAAYGDEIDVDALIHLRDVVRRADNARRPAFGPPGSLVAKRRGRGLETVDVRAYVVGDDVRHLDHNVTARTAAPHVKTFYDEQDETALLIADFRPEMLWGTRRALRSVAAAEALCLIGWRVVAQGGRVGLVVLGGEAPELASPRSREQGMLRVIGGLARAHRHVMHGLHEGRRTETSLDEALNIVDDLTSSALSSGRRSLYLATGFDRPGPEFDLWARAVQRRASLKVLLMRDAFETQPPAGVYPVLAEGDRRFWARIGKQKTPQQQLEQSAMRLERLGARVAPVDVSAGPEALISTPEFVWLDHG